MNDPTPVSQLLVPLLSQLSALATQSPGRTDGRTDGLTKRDSPTENPSPNVSRAGGLYPIDDLNGPTWVYTLFCTHNAILYVGVARDVGRRLHQHKYTKSWWPEVDGAIADLYPTRRQALDVEAHVIRYGSTLHMRNIAGKTEDPIRPHRWIERRDWDCNPHIRMHTYTVGHDGRTTNHEDEDRAFATLNTERSNP